MITFEQAYSIVISHEIPVRSENLPFMESLGRILAEDIISDIDMPPFDRSAVDGFACRRDDIIGTSERQNFTSLQCIETIPAGKIPGKQVGQGECSRIMTGAMIPEGADCVIMVEDTEMLKNGGIRFIKDKTAPNICMKGEDIKAGDHVLRKGTLVRPQDIAVMASVGACHPAVYKRIHVGILSTGDELVEPEHIPAPSKTRNSNAYQLIAQVQKAGAVPRYEGIAPDSEHALKATLSNVLDQNDIVILTGGVSVGEFDHVPFVLEKLGFEILIKSIAIQPGRPTVFAKRGDQFIFGLPGNPVSSFVLFEMLVSPFLQKCMGRTSLDPLLKLPMGTDYARKRSSRKSLIPVKIIDGELFPVEYHGSAHISAYTGAHGIIAMEAGETLLKKGDRTDVRLV